MNKAKKTYLLNAIAAVALIFLMAFQSKISHTQKVANLNVDLIQPNNQYFISEQQIRALISQQYDSIEGELVQEININLLEDTLEQIPYVEKAEVYSTLDGRLTAVVNQNKAIARVQQGSKEFYLNKNGTTMPLSGQYSAMVPLITGQVNKNNLQTAHQLLLYTDNDPFYKGFFTGVSFKDSNLTLYPNTGNYTLTFGTIQAMEKKLEKFKIFYQTTITEHNINAMATVNLIYNEQVVYTNF